MAKNVVIQRSVRASSADSLNRYAIHTADLENGSIFTLSAYKTDAGYGEVWTAADTTATSKTVWMAYSPENVVVTDDNGNQYLGLTKDPRAFTNIANVPFDCFMLCNGDIIEMTGANIADISISDYLVPSTTKALVAATSAGSGVYLKKVKTNRLVIGTGDIGGGATVTTYVYQVVVE